MTNAKNIASVKQIEDQLDQVKAIFIADYSGLNVSAQQELRIKVKEVGGELKVTKNTLLKLALKNKGVDVDSIASELEGQNITLYATDDPAAPLKVIVDYAKENEKPVIKAGVLGKDILSMAKITQLASLPSKTELIAKLIGQIQAPLAGMVNVLSAPARNLVYALNAIKVKSGSIN